MITVDPATTKTKTESAPVDARQQPENFSSHSKRSASQSDRLQTASIVIIAFLAVTQAMYVATSVMLPILTALVAALALRPIVRRMTQFGIPAMLSAGIVLGLVVGLMAFLASQLVGPATDWAQRTPIQFHLLRLQRKLEPFQEPLSSVAKASEQIGDITASAVNSDGEAQPVQEVVIRPPSLVNEVVNSTSQLAAGGFLCLVLTFFFLARGDTLVTRIAATFGPPGDTPNHGEAAIAVERCVSTYLMNVSLINAGLGIAVGIACWIIGVPNAMLWGVVAMLLNFLPYIGGLIGAAIVLGVSLLSFDSVPYAFVAPAVYLTLTAIEGNFVTPSVLGRSMSLNPLVVILSLTYWTWLWGLGGAILAVPLLAIITALFRQFKSTRGLALILSD